MERLRDMVPSGAVVLRRDVQERPGREVVIAEPVKLMVFTAILAVIEAWQVEDSPHVAVPEQEAEMIATSRRIIYWE